MRVACRASRANTARTMSDVPVLGEKNLRTENDPTDGEPNGRSATAGKRHADSFVASHQLAVVLEEGGDPAAAAALAERLGVELVDAGGGLPESSDPLLLVGSQGLSLVSGSMRLRGDLERMLPRIRRSNLSHELVVRAARVKGVEHPQVVDATAGLGEDSLLLAAAGFDVLLFERDPVIAALLADSLERAQKVPQLAGAVSRMRLEPRDSIDALPNLGFRPDVVLLDPMFPARHKSASVKKKLQLLQVLELPCSDEGELLQAARAAGPRKIIVKRPAKGPLLAGTKPSYSVSGKAIRFDCIVLPR